MLRTLALALPTLWLLAPGPPAGGPWGANSARAATVVVDAIDSGSCIGSGCAFWDPSLTGYGIGNVASAEVRSFLVFDLSGVSGPIGSASLVAYNPSAAAGDGGNGYSSANASETLGVFAMATDPASSDGPAPPPGFFEDLGSGPLYASREVSAADNGSLVSLALGSSALTALNDADGLFGLGLALTSPASGDRMMFAFGGVDGVSDTTRQLVLQIVPEPGSAALLGLGLLAASLARAGRALAPQGRPARRRFRTTC